MGSLSRNLVVCKTGVGVIIQYVEQQVTVLGIIGTTHFYAPVAQLVEHQFCKLVVVGSIPSEGSNLVST